MAFFGYSRDIRQLFANRVVHAPQNIPSREMFAWDNVDWAPGLELRLSQQQ